MPGENLTRAEAEARAAIVDAHDYHVTLDLRGEETFRSVTTVKFSATPGESTFIDLIAPEVTSIELNGESVPVSAFADSRISLDNLLAENSLTVDATCAFMNTGEGLHRFVDPVDNEVYLYTQFEVADSRRVFAVFEQPDIKAEFTFEITAPDHWTVLSNSPTPDPEPAGDGSATWAFSPTEKISSYLTAIVAGPYKGGTGTVRSADGREIPLGVYSRASLVEHLDVDNILDVTRSGFEFFEKEFGTAYPFRKYDQIFVPEFNAGAMENVGCVTILEGYVFRSRPTGALVERRAITVLHELAHMWFGDLVTMTWWNDLWLNESFAEFMSHLAAVENTKWDDAWQSFHASEKLWALRADQLPSTHPIVSDVAELDEVWANFDGITYAKGASVLRQLVEYVGRENFMAGLASYFQKYSWGNARLADLLAELEATSGRSLDEFAATWLTESGLTLLRPDFDADDDGAFTRFDVVQELVNASTHRIFRLGIGLYDLVDGKLELRQRVEADVAGERTEITELVGMQKPDLVLINDGDMGFAKIRLDDESFDVAVDHVDAFVDPMARLLALSASWDMARDAQVSAHAITDLLLRAIRVETQPTVLRVLLANLATAVKRYSAPPSREDLRARVADELVEIAQGAESGSDAQFQVTLAAADMAVTKSQLDRVEGWLEGNDVPNGVEVDTDTRWRFVQALAAAGRIDAAAVESQLEADKTAKGQEEAWVARGAVHSQEAVDAAFAAIFTDASLPNQQQRSALRGLGQNKPELLASSYAERYFDVLASVWENQTYEMAMTATTLGFPMALAGRSDLGFDVVAAATTWLDEHTDAAPSLRRSLTESVDDAKRMIAAQELDASA